MTRIPIDLSVSAAIVLASFAAAPGTQPAPPHVVFSSFLGGGGVDSARDVFVDDAGFIYVTGGTGSPGFQTTPGAYDRAFNGWHDAFAAKLSATGDVVWSTFLGGPGYDRGYAIEVDAQGIVTVAGRCGPGFPTTPGALQTTFGGDTDPNPAYGQQDGFVLRLSANGQALIWSTYFGGDGPDSPRDMDQDDAGNVYVVTGVTGPHPHVTAGAFDTTFSGESDGLVAEISADGQRLLWGSYFGGSGPDGGTPSIRVRGDGTAWVLTGTRSIDFPVTAGCYQSALGGGMDLAVLRIAPGGGSLAYATYFGGTGDEFTETHGLCIDVHGVAVVAATTKSSHLPLVPAPIPPSFQAAYRGGGGPGSGSGTNYSGDGFVARISEDGSRLLAFTYLGGPQGEGIEGVAVDPWGMIVVSGATYSSGFPVTPRAVQGQRSGAADAFVAKLSPDLSRLTFGTFLGGAGEDYGRSIAVGRDRRIALVGMTSSGNFPATPGFHGGQFDGFVSAIGF